MRKKWRMEGMYVAGSRRKALWWVVVDEKRDGWKCVWEMRPPNARETLTLSVVGYQDGTYRSWFVSVGQEGCTLAQLGGHTDNRNREQKTIFGKKNVRIQWILAPNPFLLFMIQGAVKTFFITASSHIVIGLSLRRQYGYFGPLLLSLVVAYATI